MELGARIITPKRQAENHIAPVIAGHQCFKTAPGGGVAPASTSRTVRSSSDPEFVSSIVTESFEAW